MATAAGAPPEPFALELDYPAAAMLARLPRGRHGLPRDFVERNHRYRLLGAAIDAAAERGYAAMTVADVTRHAAVSRNAFYRHFRDKEDCFLAAYDVAVEWLVESVAEAAGAAGDWPGAVIAAVERALALLAADPRLARLCAVEIFLAGPTGVDRHQALVERLAAPLRRGRAEAPYGDLLPPQLEEALLGGAVHLIACAVHSGRADHLQELAPALAELLLTPYLGAEQSRLRTTANGFPEPLKA